MDDWYFFGKNKWDWKKYKTHIIIIIFSLIMPTIYIGIHEFGHVIVSLIFGWEVTYVYIPIFPFEFKLFGYVLLNPDSMINATITELYILSISGSTLNLIIGFLMFFLWYKLKLKFYLEIFFYIFSFALISDIIVYSLVDILFINEGDWSYAFYLNPILTYFIMTLCITYVILVFLNREKIDAKADF